MSAEKATIASYSASGSLVLFGGVTLSDLALIVGMFFAAATFVLNWYYKHQQLKTIAKRVNQPFPSIVND